MDNAENEKFVNLLIVDHVGDTIVAEIDSFNDIKVDDMVEVDVNGVHVAETSCSSIGPRSEVMTTTSSQPCTAFIP